jgi:hypothetical protein
MQPGDQGEIIGRDGSYVFVKEVRGTATVRLWSAKSPPDATLAIPIRHVVSREPTKWAHRSDSYFGAA